MTMNKRTKRLHQMMEQHSLTTAQVAAMLDRSPTTVSMWRVGKPRAIPEHMLTLLELRLAAHANRPAA